MMQRHTRDAILALVSVDEAMTNDEREGIAKFLSGERRARIVPRKEAAKAIGCHPNSVDNLIKDGRLMAVRDLGGHVRGVTEESLDRYIEGRVEAPRKAVA